MHKRQITMIIGIMAVAALVAVFAIVFNSTPHEKEAVADTSSQSSKTVDKKKQSTSQSKQKAASKKDAAKSSSSTDVERNSGCQEIA
ncbi:hypothetical protein [Weissella fangxianensis]|uniref:hypothetical protein n=1 Tax=Weissella fangxianensis TaxID=2953879 RepID=UPI0021577FFB|nr:hypothetical protein [Weissella fangxianensis]